MKSFSPSVAAMMVVVLVSAAAPRPAAAAPQAPQSTSAPTRMPLDGELKTPTGEPRTGTVLLVASVYATQDDSTPLWFEQQGVTLDAAGRYTLVVGATLDDGMPKELFLTGSGRWLGIAVQGEAEQPRVMLVTVPYALKAREADTLAGRLFSDFVLSDQLKDSVKAVLNADQADGSIPGILGTTNRVVKFDGSGNATADSSIFDNGNVGIGTTSPGALLHVEGAGLAAPRLTSSDGLGDARWTFFSGAAFRGAVGWDQSSNVMGIYGAGTSGSPVISIVGASGNVGIGTTTPAEKLDVVGSINVSGNINAKYQDVAEWVETPRHLDAGTVVIVDPLESNRVLPATRAYDTRVAGAVSRQPGLLLGERSDTKAMVAQSGRVRVKVDAKYGAIQTGDLLVTSPTPGHAMRSRPMRLAGGQSLHRPGTLVGKALEPLAKGQGEILVLLTLQ